MTSRERVMMAASRGQPDVLPLGFKATDDVIAALGKHLGTTGISNLLTSLSVDTWGGFNNTTWGLFPRYAGPEPKVLYPDTYPDGSWDSIFGYRRQWKPAAVGRNDEVVTHPLSDARSVAEIEKHAWPTAALFDCSTIGEQCAEAGHRAIIFIVGGLGHFANLIGYARYLEEMILAPAIVDAGHARLTEFYVELTERVLQAASGRIDIICMQDDFGTQQGLLLSKEMYRRFYKPCHQRIYEVGHRFGALAMQHSCGAVFDLIPDFLDIGVDILDPIQTTAAGMEPMRLVKEYGRDLVFHGGLDTQSTLVHGSTEDVRLHVDRLVRSFSGAGFILAPSHFIHEDAPIENILAAYERGARHRNGMAGR